MSISKHDIYHRVTDRLSSVVLNTQKFYEDKISMGYKCEYASNGNIIFALSATLSNNHNIKIAHTIDMNKLQIYHTMAKRAVDLLIIRVFEGFISEVRKELKKLEEDV